MLRGESGAADAGPGGGARGEDRCDETSVLAASVALRYPSVVGVRGRELAEALGDHIAATAIMRGELAELRMRANVRLLADKREWAMLQPPRKTRTLTEREELKREMRPALAARIEDAEWTVARCVEEMRRMNDDFEHASREYTVLIGS